MKKYLLIIYLSLTLFTSIQVVNVEAQTRVYFSSTAAAPISPAFDGGWGVTTGAGRFALSTTKDGSAMTAKTSASSGVGVNGLIAQFVSQPLAAQTILNTGTFRVQGLRWASASGSNSPIWMMRIVSPTGTTRGYIANTYSSTATSVTASPGINRGTNNTPETISTWQLPASNISVSAGDYLVIELGGSSGSGSKTFSAIVGSSSASDLPENLTATTQDNTWVQLSQTINFLSTPATGNAMMMCID